ncbi:hypothetical protein ACJJIE_06485 [Microbulbifer sp. TRSA001]|uniref:hypothetical protein n=1 Tax=Microbulbifer sp. TRSA001 TaxID=3243381 RepID=UPI00403A641C
MASIVNAHSKIDISFRLSGRDEAYDIGLRFGDESSLFNKDHAGEYASRSALERFLGRKPIIYLRASGNRRITTAAHEFGHAMGIGHQANHTSRLMSYSHLDGVPRARQFSMKLLAGYTLIKEAKDED